MQICMAQLLLTPTHYLLFQEIQIGCGFAFLVTAYPGSPGQNPESRKTVVVIVVVVCGGEKYCWQL